MRYIYLFMIVLVCILCSSCNDDFMENYPPDKINDANYWKTVNDLRLYVNQFYSKGIMKRIGGATDDNQSDNQGYRSKDQFLWNEFAVPGQDKKWNKEAWENIKACNYFISNYTKVTGSESDIKKYLGEALMFKAMFYFEKVRYFGDVPWLNKELNVESEELYGPRISRKIVVDSICENLNRAIQYLHESTKDNRLNKYAALALKSRIALYEGTYRKYHKQNDAEAMLRQAADAAYAVMNSRLFDLYSTGNPDKDYHDFFMLQDMAGNREAILYAAYIENKRMHSRVRDVSESGSGMTKDFAESFLCTDGLPISLSPLYKGDDKFMDEFENRDLRMKQIIYTPDQPYQIDENGTIRYEAAPVFSNIVYTGYRMYKMFSPLTRDQEYQRCTIDDCLFRYAEVLLNYAEAKEELGECDKTVLEQTIDKLRIRAGMPAMSITPEFTDPNWPQWEEPISARLNEIRRERRIELASEGFRWDDLCRWKAGKLLNNIKTYLGAKDPQTGTYRVLYPGSTRVWNDRQYLRPIPTDEFSYNPNLLPQNPGWD